MFVFSEEYGQLIYELNDIVFTCDAEQGSYGERMKKLANAYSIKLEFIIQFMIKDRLQEFYGCDFGKLTVANVKPKLGKPVIDLDVNYLTYTGHTFDEEHCINVEFEGVFEKLNYCSVD